MSFSNDEWGEWVDFYGGCFGWLSDADLRMFDAWRRVFAASGYTMAELRDAAKALAANPPKWRSDHLARIHQHVRESRFAAQVAREREAREANEKKPCELCGDTGLVVVPHSRAVVNGEWRAPFYTMGVACECGAGFSVRSPMIRRYDAWVENNRKGKMPPVIARLQDYERENPFWREQVRQKAEAQKAEVAAREASHGADRIAQRERLRRNFGEALNDTLKAIEEKR